jgi:hypothetical protein
MQNLRLQNWIIKYSITWGYAAAQGGEKYVLNFCGMPNLVKCAWIPIETTYQN